MFGSTASGSAPTEAATPPSAELVAELARLDAETLTPDAALEALAAWATVAAWVQAHSYRLLASLDASASAAPASMPGGSDKQWVREEVACALGISSDLAAAKLAEAREIVTRLPAALELLTTGELDGFRVRAIAEATVALTDDEAAAVQDRVVSHAPLQTLAGVRRSLKRAVLALAPHTVARVRQRDHAARTVRIRPSGIDMCELWALLPAQGAAALMSAVDALAGQTGDERTADQRRADALVQLGIDTVAGTVGTSEPIAIRGGSPLRPAVQVTVALSTLLGIDDQPGQAEGIGAISAELARAIAHDPSGTWRRLVVDERGQLLDYGRTTYRPPAALARHVLARDRTCRFPGCARPAARCELDHVRDWQAGGSTSADNLHALCRRHHHAKHEAGWRVHRDCDGTTTWTSPRGRRYMRTLEPYPLDRTSGPDPPADLDG